MIKSTKIFHAPLQTHKKEGPPKQASNYNTAHTQNMAVSPVVLQNQNSSESGGHQYQKCSMNRLCQLYLQKVNSKSPCEFKAKDLILNTNIKQRRVYDLMNILQGCGYVKRISKGKYQSYRLEAEQQPIKKRYVNYQQTSLTSMAFQVKRLLRQAEQFMEFKDLCGFVFEWNTNKKFNIESLKRRVYECCKVFKTLGLAQKNGSSFRWKGEFTKLPIDQAQQKRKLKLKKQKNKKVQYQSENDRNNALMQQILSKIQTQNDLNEFIDNLRSEFARKTTGLTIKRQLIYD